MFPLDGDGGLGQTALALGGNFGVKNGEEAVALLLDGGGNLGQ